MGRPHPRKGRASHKGTEVELVLGTHVVQETPGGGSTLVEEELKVVAGMRLCRVAVSSRSCQLYSVGTGACARLCSKGYDLISPELTSLGGGS